MAYDLDLLMDMRLIRTLSRLLTTNTMGTIERKRFETWCSEWETLLDEVLYQTRGSQNPTTPS
jgi:hypothetical protein